VPMPMRTALDRVERLRVTVGLLSDVVHTEPP
jgi:hypothetical protein